jgi:hypothetical protein
VQDLQVNLREDEVCVWGLPQENLGDQGNLQKAFKSLCKAGDLSIDSRGFGGWQEGFWEGFPAHEVPGLLGSLM